MIHPDPGRPAPAPTSRAAAPARRRAAFTVAVAAVVGLSVACGSSGTQDTSAASSPATTAAAASSAAATGSSTTGSSATGSPTTTGSKPKPAGPTVDPAVFQGQATTIDGQPFDLGSLANKDLVVWFWAPW